MFNCSGQKCDHIFAQYSWHGGRCVEVYGDPGFEPERRFCFINSQQGGKHFRVFPGRRLMSWGDPQFGMPNVGGHLYPMACPIDWYTAACSRKLSAVVDNAKQGKTMESAPSWRTIAHRSSAYE